MSDADVKIKNASARVNASAKAKIKNAKTKAEASAKEKAKVVALGEAAKSILRFANQDLTREGLIDTPKRFAKAWGDLLAGYKIDIDKLLSVTFNEDETKEMIILKSIDYFSVCEHHLLPFYGKAHVAYIPSKGVLGMSKIVRLVEAYARRLQIQERLTEQVANALMKTIKPIGVGVVISGVHMCSCMRGVKAKGSEFITCSLKGVFRENSSCRNEFLSLVKD